MIVGYKVWYADGSCLSTRDVSWADMPSEGIQIVMPYSDELDGMGRRIRPPYKCYWDFYFMMDGVVDGANEIPAGAEHVKKGQWVSNEEWPKIFDKAYADMEF